MVVIAEGILRGCQGFNTKSDPAADSMEITIKAGLLYFDYWLFQPEWTNLVFEGLGGHMPTAADDLFQ